MDADRHGRRRGWIAGAWVAAALLVAGSCGREEDTGPRAGGPPSVSTTVSPRQSQPAEAQTAPAETGPGFQANTSMSSSSPEADTPRPSLPGAVLPAPVAPFRPLIDAKVGEWAQYEALDGRTLRYEIVKVEETAVTTRVTVHDHGKLLGAPAERRDDREFDPVAGQQGSAQAERRLTYTTTQAAGRQWTAMLYEDRWTDEEVRYVRRTWVSALAPVFGLLRMELYGDGQLEARLELKKVSG